MRASPLSSSSDPWVSRAWASTQFIDNNIPLRDESRAIAVRWRENEKTPLAAYIIPSESDSALTDAHVIVFRTTSTLMDVAHDFDMRQVRFMGNTRVHRGMYRMYTKVRDKLHALILEHAPSKLLLCGHSLGGGIACLAAVDVRAFFDGVQIHLVTFGAPRVGDATFASLLESSTRSYLRVSAPNDLIPDFPGVLLGFTHGNADDIGGSLLSVVARLINACIAYFASPRSFHFHHIASYYDNSLRSRRAIVHVHPTSS